ncbi:uncharacterized protein C8A04DRAFT_40105 [Dichotomopilus funicola]|uniref:Uncharacterized protein n=1 Tax=Dichotomopilus funicola TaxID=1934379 RepID=A0AAN6UWH6_9PEZI|nr:hypothetical protein C8A04DRAFT_40105 [Dichotomopilus funicola]
MVDIKAPWEGGLEEFRMLQAAMSEVPLLLHCPPDFPQNSEIIGVCGVSVENSDQNKYGWMVADFLHWKLLSNGIGDRKAQTWLSSLDIAKFLGGVDSVDDGTIHNIVGEDKQSIISLPTNEEGFADSFLEHVVERASVALLKRSALVIMAFVPVTPEQDICMDFGEKKVYLTVEHIRTAIQGALGDVKLPVTLITPSPLTGGWLCRPSLMGGHTCSSSDKMMRLMAKACSGAFAERFIRSFTEGDSPLLTDSHRQKIKFNDPMPLRPTQVQTNGLHQFQRQIHETLERRFSGLARVHGFVLSPESVDSSTTFSDAWTEYGPRQGRSLSAWNQSWGPHRPQVSHPQRFEFLGGAFGGTRESQVFHMKYLIAIELGTNPGDWDRSVGGGTRNLFTNFTQIHFPSEDDVKRVFDAIEFRTSSIILAQMVAKAFNLPTPGDRKCRYWHDTMDGMDEEQYKRLQYSFSEAYRLFGYAAVFPGERQHEFKNVRFPRPARWLSAAIALHLPHASRQDIEGFVCRDISRFVAKVSAVQRILLLEDQMVTRIGRDWIATLGLDDGIQLPVLKSNTSPIGGLKINNQTPKSFLLNSRAKPWNSDSKESDRSEDNDAGQFPSKSEEPQNKGVAHQNISARNGSALDEFAGLMSTLEMKMAAAQDEAMGFATLPLTTTRPSATTPEAAQDVNDNNTQWTASQEPKKNGFGPSGRSDVLKYMLKDATSSPPTAPLGLDPKRTTASRAGTMAPAASKDLLNDSTNSVVLPQAPEDLLGTKNTVEQPKKLESPSPSIIHKEGAVEQAIKSLAEALAATGTVNGTGMLEAQKIARALRKAAEIIEKEEAQGTALEGSQFNSAAKSPINGDSAFSVEFLGNGHSSLATASPLNWRHETVNGDNGSGIPTKRVSSAPRETAQDSNVGFEFAGLKVGEPMANLQSAGSFDTNTPRRPSNAAVGSHVVKDETAAASHAANPSPKVDTEPLIRFDEKDLTSGDDFWARAGIKF